jgi:hypothetical protein
MGDELLHSPTPIGQGPRRGCLYSRVSRRSQNAQNANFAFTEFLRSSALLGILLWFCAIRYIYFSTREYDVFVAWPAVAA